MPMSRLVTADSDKKTGCGKTGRGAVICRISSENVVQHTSNGMKHGEGGTQRLLEVPECSRLQD